MARFYAQSYPGYSQERFERLLGVFPLDPAAKLATFSKGMKRQAALVLALACRPKLLLLDEPSLGLAPLIIRDIFHALQEIRAEGTTILIVEQNALATLKIADRAYVLELGRISMEGRADVLIHDERLIEAYLGNKKS